MKKKIYLVLVCLFLIVVLSSCGIQKVDKGYEGIKINTLGSAKGDVNILNTGWHFYNSIKYDIVQNPTFIQEYVWTRTSEEGSQNDESITFQSSNSLAFTADIGISFRLLPGKTGELYEEYHKTVEDLIDSNLRNSVRDAFNRLASKRDEEGIYGKGKTKFISDVEADVRNFWKDYLDIKKIYLIGKLDPPPQVKLAISNKIAATQKAAQRRNEVEESKANADKKIEDARGVARSKEIAADATAYSTLKEATAKAEAIKLVNKQLSKSPEYIEYIKANNWDGKLPVYMGGSSPVPFINVN